MYNKCDISPYSPKHISPKANIQKRIEKEKSKSKFFSKSDMYRPKICPIMLSHFSAKLQVKIQWAKSRKTRWCQKVVSKYKN